MEQGIDHQRKEKEISRIINAASSFSDVLFSCIFRAREDVKAAIHRYEQDVVFFPGMSALHVTLTSMRRHNSQSFLPPQESHRFFLRLKDIGVTQHYLISTATT